MTGVIVALLLGAGVWVLYGPRSAPAPGTGMQSGPVPSRRPAPGRPRGASGNGGQGVSDPALLLDLTAAMLEAGRPLPIGLRILSESAGPALARIITRVVTALELGSGWKPAWELALSVSGGTPQGSTPQGRAEEAPDVLAAAGTLRDALAFAAASGAPSAAVLHAQADQIRRRRARESERRAAALGIQLVLPLGLCALPAFICLTVLPLLLALLPAL